MRPVAGKTPEAPDFAKLFAMADESGQKRYEANKYQLTHSGLDKDGLAVGRATLRASDAHERGGRRRDKVVCQPSGPA
jgi:hypothetical protein